MAFPERTNIENNDRLRFPQRDGWKAIRDYYEDASAARDIGVVLPVGCGKSGLIAITPFALTARRVSVK